MTIEHSISAMKEDKTMRGMPVREDRILRYVNAFCPPGASDLIADKTGLSVRTVRAILAGKKPSARSAERLWEFAYQQSLF